MSTFVIGFLIALALLFAFAIIACIIVLFLQKKVAGPMGPRGPQGLTGPQGVSSIADTRIITCQVTNAKPQSDTDPAYVKIRGENIDVLQSMSEWAQNSLFNIVQLQGSFVISFLDTDQKDYDIDEIGFNIGNLMHAVAEDNGYGHFTGTAKNMVGFPNNDVSNQSLAPIAILQSANLVDPKKIHIGYRAASNSMTTNFTSASHSNFWMCDFHISYTTLRIAQ